MTLELSATVMPPAVFVNHVVKDHGMDSEGTWFNLPTTRSYHEFLHEQRASQQTHTHREAE